jgi:serine/threonine-protein kinase RsbW
MEQVSREFPSDPRQLAAMRGLVRDTCLRVWDPRETDSQKIAQLELAVTEAAANVILHAYAGQEGQTLELTVGADADGVCVTLYHRGEPFDPEAVRPPSFDGSRESGFGLYIIRLAVDEVTYFEDDRGRRAVRLVKKR